MIYNNCPTFCRLFEIRDVADLDSTVRAEISPPVQETAAATTNVSKPQRPGKGRAQVAKFQADE